MPAVKPAPSGRKELHFGPNRSEDERETSLSASPRSESASPNGLGNNINHYGDSSASEQPDNLSDAHNDPWRPCNYDTPSTPLSSATKTASPALTNNSTTSLLGSSGRRGKHDETELTSTSTLDLNPSAKLLCDDLVGWEGCSAGLDFETILSTYLYGNSSLIDLIERYPIFVNEED